jgi:hypothetical protein
MRAAGLAAVWGDLPGKEHLDSGTRDAEHWQQIHVRWASAANRLGLDRVGVCVQNSTETADSHAGAVRSLVVFAACETDAQIDAGCFQTDS